MFVLECHLHFLMCVQGKMSEDNIMTKELGHDIHNVYNKVSNRGQSDEQLGNTESFRG